MLILKKVIQATPFRGSYIAGIYYPTTKWMVEKHPEYFASFKCSKLVGIDEINGNLDLNTCTAVKTFVVN
jgi:hypothetical protein